jgi:hypothetical protein
MTRTLTNLAFKVGRWRFTEVAMLRGPFVDGNLRLAAPTIALCEAGALSLLEEFNVSLRFWSRSSGMLASAHEGLPRRKR